MSTHPGSEPSATALPTDWPSAWPSMRKNVLVGSIVPVVAALIVLIILALTKAIGSAWWVILLPLVLLIWPLSLPMRVRKVMQDAADGGGLQITRGMLGTIAAVRERRLGVRPNAEVVPGSDVRYYLNSGRRAQVAPQQPPRA